MVEKVRLLFRAHQGYVVTPQTMFSKSIFVPRMASSKLLALGAHSHLRARTNTREQSSYETTRLRSHIERKQHMRAHVWESTEIKQRQKHLLKLHRALRLPRHLHFKLHSQPDPPYTPNTKMANRRAARGSRVLRDKAVSAILSAFPLLTTLNPNMSRERIQ